MCNIEIGESVPGTWEPLPCFMVNAEVETSWQPSIRRNGQRPNGERASSKIAWAPSQSVSCIPIQVTAWLEPGSAGTRPLFDRRAWLLKKSSVNADLIRFVIRTKPTKPSGGSGRMPQAECHPGPLSRRGRKFPEMYLA